MESLSPQVVSAAKLPILNPNKFDLWKMRIEQYFLMTDYSLWEVILNGDSPSPTRVIEGVVQPVAPTTTEHRLARKNELKAHGTLLMALPDKHQLNFNIHKDAKNLMKAIEKSTNEPVSAATSVSAVSAKIPVSALPNVDTLSNDVIYSFFASQSNSPQLDNDDLRHIDVDDLEEIDLKWKMAMLTCDGVGSYDWSLQAEEEPTSYALMAFSSSSSSSFNNESDDSLPASLQSDRYNSEDGYHAVPPPYTGTFMPPKPDLVFNNAPNVNETVHTAFNVELSPTKSSTYLSHTHRSSAPIIKDWVSDSKDDSEPEIPQNAPTTTPKTAIPKPKSHGKSRNRKACFVCKSLTYLIKDCDFYEKKMAQTPPKNHAKRENHQQYARMTLPNPQRHVVPIAFLTQSKQVPITAVRPITTAVPKTKVTRPRQAKTVITKPHSPPRRHINRSPSAKVSNFPLKVTAVKAPMDKGVIDSGYSRHMIGNKKNRVLVTKPHNKTPYELLHGRTLSISFKRPFGYPVTILNTLDSLGKFDGKVDEGFLVGYSVVVLHGCLKKKMLEDITDFTYSDDEEDVGAEADFTNLETTITEEGIDYKEVFTPKTRIKAIKLFLAYASFIGFMVYQMDVKSAFLYETIEEEVYVCQPPGFEDPDYPDKVYKVVKALYRFHQAPSAWYETLANYILENGFQRGKIDQTLFIKRQQGDILLVQIYVDDIIFGSTNKELCKAFEKLMKDKFQISSMGELTFFLGLHVKQKPDGIFISQDKYVAKILRKFDLTNGKSAITHIDTEKPLLKDPNGQMATGKEISNPFMAGNEFTSSMASAVICLSTGRKFNFSKYIFDSLMRNVDSPSKFYMYPQFIQLMIRAQVSDLYSHSIKYSSPALTQKVFANMRRVGFSRADTPLFEGMIVAQEVGEGAAKVDVKDVPTAGVAAEGAASVADDDVNATIDEPSIPSPTRPTQSPPPLQYIPSTSQVLPTPSPSLIAQPPSPQQQPQPSYDAEISMDLLYTLLDTLEVVTTTKLITEVVTAASATITAADALIPAATITVAALTFTIALSAARRRKGVVIRDPKETTTPSTIIHTKPKSKDKGKRIMVHVPKPPKKKTQIEQDESYARELEAELNKNID
nr:putative ribonuclease H-like domain-containing protein [Tanacetum cinerariifolium]